MLEKRNIMDEEGVIRDGVHAKAPEHLSPGTDGNKKRKGSRCPSPLVDTQVRRSERVRQGSNGFKSSGCSSKKCISCNPPTLSTKVIKSLGVQFCSMDDEPPMEENLLKGGMKEPVAKKKNKASRTTKNPKENGDEGKQGEDGTSNNP